MANKKTHKLTIKGLYVDGKKCSKPVIELLEAPNVAINCVSDCEYTFQIPDGLEGQKCFNFRVSCPDSCVDCSQIIRKCLCDDNGDCGACEECCDGFCEKLCPEEQCFNGRCAECNVDGGCPCDQICRNGKCVCPTGKKAEGDCCVDCDANTPCPPCYECVGGECLPKCPDSQCDPETETCVTCTADSHCDQTKGCQKCVNGECECCDGYTKDCNGDCVPIPTGSCSFNGDCSSDCESCQNIDPCTGLGTCVPQQCPAGYICVNGDCREECDCAAGGCTKGSATCTQLNDFQCYCSDCSEFSCTEEGATACGGVNSKECQCNEAGACVPNPCGQSDCVYNSDCRGGSGDNNCFCDGGTCRENPCNNAPCTKSSDCQGGGDGQGCVCEEGVCVPGENDGTCNTNLSLEKIEDGNNCDLKASLSLDCCPCPVLDVEIVPSVSGDSVTFSGTLYKDGERLSISTPTNNNTGNEEPSFGRLSYEVSTGFACTTAYPNGYNYTYNVGVDDGSNSTSDFGGTDTTSGGGVGTTTTYNPSTSDTDCVISGHVIRVYLETTYVPGSDCTYNRQLIYTYRVNSLSELSTVTAEAYSSDCKHPIFEWRRDGQVIRRLYIPGDGSYEDTLKGPEGSPLTGPMEDVNLPSTHGMLESCHDYTVEVDCDCGGPVTENVIFCKTVDEFTAEIVAGRECSDQITYTIPSTCDVNHHLRFKVTATTRNGAVIIDDYFGRDLAVTKTLIANIGDCFNDIKLEMYCNDGSIACDNVVQFQDNDPTVTATYNCPDSISFTSDSLVIDTISITNLVGGSQSISGTQNYNIPSASKRGGSITYFVTFLNCNKTYDGQFSWTCNCLGDPCQGRNCGDVEDECGNIVSCGTVPADKTVDNGCCGDGTRCYTDTNYFCDGNGQVQTQVINRTQVDATCDPVITTFSYNCVSGNCQQVLGSGGTYISLNQCQTLCQTNTTTYNCVSGNCQQVTGSGGQYSTLSQCNNACGVNPTTSYNCISGNCQIINNSTGQYSTLAQCNSSCGNTVTTYNCISGSCIAVSGSGGQYSSLSTCQSLCQTTTTTYNCIAGTCSAVSGSGGQYATASICAANCSPPDRSFNCVNGSCIQVNGTSGTYQTSSACISDCANPNLTSWDCNVSSGSCFERQDTLGQYADQSTCNANCQTIPETWDCVSGNCQSTTSGNGQYASLGACQTNCQVPNTWDCISGNCQLRTDGSGFYSVLSQCESACVINDTFDCVSGTCITRTDGSGAYTTLAQCNSNCTIPDTWDCVNLNCVVRTDGSGAYSTQTACETACTAADSWDCVSGSCVLRTDGSGQYGSVSTCNDACGIISYDCVNGECTTFQGSGGDYATLAACESVCGNTTTYNCVNNNCVSVSGSGGTYSTLNACETACTQPDTWDCVNDLCVLRTDGSGAFSMLSTCESNCGGTNPTSYNCVNDMCTQIAGTGGTYSTLSACELACQPTQTSYNCVSNNCIEVTGTGGTYSTEAACIADGCEDTTTPCSILNCPPEKPQSSVDCGTTESSTCNDEDGIPCWTVTGTNCGECGTCNGGSCVCSSGCDLGEECQSNFGFGCSCVTTTPTGACCVGTSCSVVTQATCEDPNGLNGDYKGDGVACTTGTCDTDCTAANCNDDGEACCDNECRDTTCPSGQVWSQDSCSCVFDTPCGEALCYRCIGDPGGGTSNTCLPDSTLGTLTFTECNDDCLGGGTGG